MRSVAGRGTPTARPRSPGGSKITASKEKQLADGNNIFSATSTSDVVAAVAAEAVKLGYAALSPQSRASGSSSMDVHQGYGTADTLLSTLVRNAAQRLVDERKELKKSGVRGAPRSIHRNESSHPDRARPLANNAKTSRMRAKSKQNFSNGREELTSQRGESMPSPLHRTIQAQEKRSASEEELVVCLTRATHEIDVLREARKELAAQNLELEDHAAKLSHKCESLSAELVVSKAEVGSLESRVAAAEQNFAILLTWAREEELSRREALQEIERISAECKEGEDREVDLVREVEAIRGEEQDCHRRLEAALEDATHKASCLGNLEGRLQAAAGEAEALRSLLASREAEASSLKGKVDALVREAKTLSDENISLKKRLSESVALHKQSEMMWETKIRERDLVQARKEEESAALSYRLQQMTSRLDNESRLRWATEKAAHERPLHSPKTTARPLHSPKMTARTSYAATSPMTSSPLSRSQIHRPQPIVLSDDECGLTGSTTSRSNPFLHRELFTPSP